MCHDPQPLSAAETSVVEIDSTDTDSAYTDEISTYSTSLSSSIKNHEWSNGRRYHSYRSGTYKFPNDEKEQDRLDMFHHFIFVAMGRKTHLAPFKTEGARVLDIGTGTGIWVMDMGDQHPEIAEIVGNDLSPIQPSWVPPNVKFIVDDVEEPWVDQNPYDYIHSRYMAASIANWPRLVKNCFDNLRPGGWVEFQDYDCDVKSEDGTVKPDNKIKEMLHLLDTALQKIPRVLSPGPMLEQWVKDAGFVNVEVRKLKIPIGTWPRDKNMKEIGAFMSLQYTEGVEAFTNVPFTQILGWTPDEVTVLNAQVREAVKDRKTHARHDFYIVTGQKPEATDD